MYNGKMMRESREILFATYRTDFNTTISSWLSIENTNMKWSELKWNNSELSYLLVSPSSIAAGCSLSDESKVRLTNTQTGSDLIGGFSTERNYWWIRFKNFNLPSRGGWVRGTFDGRSSEDFVSFSSISDN